MQPRTPRPYVGLIDTKASHVNMLHFSAEREAEVW